MTQENNREVDENDVSAPSPDPVWPRVIKPVAMPSRPPSAVLDEIRLAVYEGYRDQLFLFNEQLMYVPPMRVTDTIDGKENLPAPMRPVNDKMLSYFTRECAVLEKTPRPLKVDVVPFREVQEILAMAPELWHDRPIKGFTHAPFLAPGGRIVTEPGYDEETGYYNRYRGSLVSDITADIVRDVLERMFTWYPFDSEMGVAHAIGMHLTPLVRPAIKGATPAFLIVAHDKNMGKTELASQPIVLAHGVLPAATLLKEGADDSNTWLIDSLLSKNPAYMLFDNIASDGTIANSHLEMLLTSNSTATRLARSGAPSILKISPLWLFTGNRVMMSPDMARRTVEMRFSKEGEEIVRPIWETARERGELKALDWTVKHRDLALSVMFYCIEQWIDRGCPRPERSKIGESFSAWDSIVGGIVGVIGDILNEGRPDHKKVNLREEWLSLPTRSGSSSGWQSVIENWPCVLGSDQLLTLTSGELVELMRTLDALATIFPKVPNGTQLKDFAGKHIAGLSNSSTDLWGGWYLASETVKKKKQRVYWPAKK